MLKKVKNARILITGGAGFIGSHLTDELLRKGHLVSVLDNLTNGSLDNLINASTFPDFNFINGDILNPDLCKEVSEGFDYIFHLACLGVRHSLHSPLLNHKVNAEGTLNILQAAKENKIKHFYYISSSEIYGKVKEFPIKETSLPEPLTVYGASKLVGEYYTRAFEECYGLKATVLRIFNNYGPRAHYEGDAGEIIPRSIVKLLYDEQPVIFGKGEITRDFFYVKDTAKVLSELINYDNLTGETINIGTGIEITMKYLIELILKLMNKDDIGISYLEDRPADVPRLWVDASLFKNLTGFVSETSFEDGLLETINYYKELKNNKNLIEEIANMNWLND
jgi:UDP-glucose 4-epimerase